ncbi:hypothetical protein BB559_002161, partial [Furculomyces boomerangus]
MSLTNGWYFFPTTWKYRSTPVALLLNIICKQQGRRDNVIVRVKTLIFPRTGSTTAARDELPTVRARLSAKSSMYILNINGDNNDP